MHAYRLGKVAAIAAALACVGGALAEEGAVQVQGDTGELGVQKKAVLTPAEQAEQADKIGRRAQQLGERLTRMLDESRRDKDILRANCVNRKLTEVNANTRNVEQRSKALKDAAATNDDARRNHEFTVLSVLSQKLESLGEEAAQCLGQAVYEPGASQVITTIPVDAPTLDPAVVPVAPVPPPAVSVPPPGLEPPVSPMS